MTARKLSIVVLGIAAYLVCMGCRPAIQPSVEDQKSCLSVKKRGSPKLMQLKLDGDSFRMRLLMVELVQKDLRLTANQIRELKILCDTHKAQARELYAKLLEIHPPSQSLPQEEFEARIPKFRALSEDLKSENKKLQTKGLAILTPSQAERLNQIQLQATIPEALICPEIVKVLHISEEQLEKIRTLRDQMDQKQSAKWSDLSNLNQEESLIEFVKTSYRAQVETTNRILDILTPEQRTKIEKLTGKKIDLTRLYDAWVPENAE